MSIFDIAILICFLSGTTCFIVCTIRNRKNLRTAMEGIQDKENDAILFRKLEGLRQETRTLNDNSDRFHQDTQDLIKETQKLQMLFNALTRELETFRQECMESEKSDKNTEK